MAHGMCRLFQGPDGSDSQHSLPWTLQAQPSHRSLVLPSSLLPIKLNQAYGPVFLGQTKERCCETRYGLNARFNLRVEMVKVPLEYLNLLKNVEETSKKFC